MFNISNWDYQWKISFNLDPSKQDQEVIFSRNKMFFSFQGHNMFDFTLIICFRNWENTINGIFKKGKRRILSLRLRTRKYEKKSRKQENSAKNPYSDLISNTKNIE